MATLSAAAIAPASSGVSSTTQAPSNRPPPESPRASQSISQVRYLSPVISIDAEAGLALLQVRDVENGNVRFQLPPERVVREYKSVEAANALPANQSEAPGREAEAAPGAETGAPKPATAAEAAATSSLTSTDPKQA